MTALRTQTIAAFRGGLSPAPARTLAAALRQSDERTRAEFVRQCIAAAFVAAGTLTSDFDFDADELLFALAALPHDSCLDSRIDALGQSPDAAQKLFGWWKTHYGAETGNAIRQLCGQPV